MQKVDVVVVVYPVLIHRVNTAIILTTIMILMMLLQYRTVEVIITRILMHAEPHPVTDITRESSPP
jgi:hypothetical protein